MAFEVDEPALLLLSNLLSNLLSHLLSQLLSQLLSVEFLCLQSQLFERLVERLRKCHYHDVVAALVAA